MKLKIALAAASIAASAMFATAANALPLYFGYSLNGGPIQLAATSNGFLSFNTMAMPGFDLFSGQATGSPLTSPGNLLSNQLSLSSDPGANGFAGTIDLYFSQTGLTFQPGGFMTGFGNNGGSSMSITEMSYVQACAAAVCGGFGSADVFSTANMLSQQVVVPGASSSSAFVLFPGSIAPGQAYNETLRYSFTIAAGQNANSNLSLNAVPEPLTLSLFGAGIAGIAAMRRRKKAA